MTFWQALRLAYALNRPHQSPFKALRSAIAEATKPLPF